MPRKISILEPVARSAFRRRSGAFVTAVVASVVGCGELTSVETLDVVQPSDLESRTGAQTMRAGAITRFTETFVGTPTNSNSVTLMSARISDEFQATIIDPVDRRDVPELSTETFGLLSRARVDLLQAIRAMQRFDPSSSSEIAELFALLAYIELFFGEMFCSGVPLSSIVQGQPAYGEQLTTVELLERSIASFDSASTYAENPSEPQNLARVGRARALLQLGRLEDAAAAVATVPTDFLYQTSHGSNVQQNGIWSAFYVRRAWTVADREGENGLDFVTAQDPRVPTQPVGIGQDSETPVYAPEQHSAASSSVVLASGIEARLIEAEAQLIAGDAPTALAKLNDLRGRIPGLDPLRLAPTESTRIDQLFRERAFWLFATGHRHGDLRRLIRQYGRDSESVFPTGAYHRGGLTYGTEVTLGLDELERVNPHFTGGCFHRDP